MISVRNVHYVHLLHDMPLPPWYTQDMPIFTSEEIAEQKVLYKAALKAVATSQEYVVGRKRLTRATLSEIRATLEWLETEEQKLNV